MVYIFVLQQMLCVQKPFVCATEIKLSIDAFLHSFMVYGPSPQNYINTQSNGQKIVVLFGNAMTMNPMMLLF